MALVVLSERSPLDALGSVFRRCAYVLMPFSFLLLKYFPEFGVEFNMWSGERSWVGVALQKNGLGLICALTAFFLIWAWRTDALPTTRVRTFADGLTFALAILLLRGPGGSYSATSVTALLVGTASLLLLYRMKDRMRRVANSLVLAAALLVSCLPFASSLASASSSILGRDATFTGRTDVWDMALDIGARHPILGVGFGAFWGLQNEFYARFAVTTGHCGYVDVYVEVGMVGIVMLLAFLLAFHRRALRELDHSCAWGVFGICLLIMSLLYNFTESAFLKTSNYFWNAMVFVTVVFSAPCLAMKESDCASDGRFRAPG